MPDHRAEIDAPKLWASAEGAPAHVPPELARSFSFFNGPGIAQCPFKAVSALRQSSPRIFFNTDDPQCGGAWVLTQAEDFRTVFVNPELFSSQDITGFAALMGESWPLLPLEVDPPLHRTFRALLNPMVGPAVVTRLSEGMRGRAVALIAAFSGKGGCEFVADFGRPFPVGVFLQLMGLPESDTDQFMSWEFDLLHNLDLGVKAQAAAAIRGYLLDLMAHRRRHPAEDLATYVVQGAVDGRLLNDEEVLGMYYLLFVGGLDTVAASLGCYFRYLAENPATQARLRADPALIPRATEEFLRAFSPVTTRRIVTRDTELAGAQLKQGDWVTCVTAFASLDPLEFDQPMQVEFDRPHNRHLGFAFGPHFCAGSHLARREIHIAFEEWMRRIPPFRIAPGFAIQTHGGPVMGLEELQLVWD